MIGGFAMVYAQDNLQDKINSLSEEQYHILNVILDAFNAENQKKKDVNKRIGIAKDISFPSDFDDIDFGTSELFGID